MKELLTNILEKLVELTQVAQEFHRNVKGELYFCLHKAFNDDYDTFFGLQDSIGELIVQKEWVAHITYCHEPSPDDITCHEMVAHYLWLLKWIKEEVEGVVNDVSFPDADALNDILEYVDKKIMMYSAFLKK